MNPEVEENIRKNVQWAQLPAHIKQVKQTFSYTYVNKYLLSVSYVYLTITFSDARQFIKKLR